jgi:hypothetical protein
MTRTLALALAVALAACTNVKSSDIKTSGMSAHMAVTADGTGTARAQATLNVDNNVTDFVDLSAGDTLNATVGSQTQQLMRLTLGGAVSYAVDFQGQDAAGTQYTIALTRKNDTSAPSSTCALPGPFAITAPAASATFSRATQDVQVTWSPSATADRMTYSLTGDCLRAILTTDVQGDPGALTLTKAMIQPSDANHSGSNCQATLTLKRTKAGSLDKAYGYGGEINAVQTRSVVFMSTP